MKKTLIAFSLVLALGNAFAQSIIEVTSATTLLPFVTATRLLQSGTATILSPLATTLATVQARGVAGKEQLKDELVNLNDDMAEGLVDQIEDVRQPALKELFLEIASNENEMKKIDSVISEGSNLHKVASAVTIALLLE